MDRSRRAVTFALSLMSALALAAPAASTQEMSAPQTYPIGFGIAGGLLVPTGDVSDLQSTGWNLQGFVDWTSGTSPFGVRGDISFGSLMGKDITVGGVTASASNLHLFSITGDGVWMIRPAPGSTSRTTPYLLAGIGLYHASTEASVGGVTEDNSSTDFGINFGGGVLYELAGFSTFAEIRYHNVFSGASSDGESTSAHYIPIVVGLRFGTR